MVRVIAELSTSSEQYNYSREYDGSGGGSGGSTNNIATSFAYTRPAPAPCEKMSQKRVEKIPLLVTNGCGDNDEDEGGDGGVYINNNLAKINETKRRISVMVEMRRSMYNIQETQQMREINQKSEKQKQEERRRQEQEESARKREQEDKRRQEDKRQQEEQRKREQDEKEREINYKLGEIIYATPNGKLFRAHHSTCMTVRSIYDKKTKKMVETYTEKVIWNDIVFESKQDWFSEMRRLSVA
jgi:flagellar biosynthesis GTPase FlhF